MRKCFTILTVLLMSSALAFGQDYLDVPPWDGTTGTPLIDVITGDTTETGDRVSDNRVYVLERDGVYMITSTLYADYSFSMIAADGEGRPPLLISSKTAEGAVVLPFMKMTSNDETYLFENIIFQAVNTDLVQAFWTHAFHFIGNNTNITFQSCVFNGWTGRSANFFGEHNSVYFRDVVWRNATHTDHPFVGQQINFAPGMAQDTLIITNCTQFNANGYWLHHRGALMDYMVIEHNTFVVTMTTLFATEHMVNASIRSNIFYGTYSLGDHPIAQRDKWYTFDGGAMSIVCVDPVQDTILSAGGLTEADRRIILTNNAYFTPEEIQAVHDANDTLASVVWMNDRIQGMFDDNEAYPLLVNENNVEMDPVFANTAMDNWVCTETAKGVEEFMMHPPGAFWGTTSSIRNYDFDTDPETFLLIDWPLIEGDMEITESFLLTAGHDGLPVGNLNWNPALRAQYREPSGAPLGVEDNLKAKMGFSLGQNYPNPFNQQTRISYSMVTGADVNISVYNVLNQKVATIVNEYRNAGDYAVMWNAADVPAGIYFYRLESAGFTQTKKMLLVK